MDSRSGRERGVWPGRDGAVASLAGERPMSGKPQSRAKAESDLLARVRAAARQEQFLEVVSAEEARSRFEKHLDLKPLAGESVALADALGRTLAHDVIAQVDA